ncbi:hypothetical protein TNCV_3724481 [Trichonephila clavipes]|nr:hypothetical protein TNCV_3724481 [Trichonephila clavipes]
MSSVATSASSPVQWNRRSPSILAWPQSEQASLAARPSQWWYTPKRSYPAGRRKRATASALSRCHSGHSFPWLSTVLGLLDHDSIFVNECGNNTLCSSENQGDFR